MEELAGEVVKQLRAQDGDLDVWVRFHWCSSNYKIQPTVRDGRLRWLWCGQEHANEYTLLLEDVDDLMAFLYTEFPVLEGMGAKKLSSPSSFLILSTTGNKCLLRYSATELGAGDRLKQFLLRCWKIEMCEKKTLSIVKL